MTEAGDARDHHKSQSKAAAGPTWDSGTRVGANETLTGPPPLGASVRGAFGGSLQGPRHPHETPMG